MQSPPPDFPTLEESPPRRRWQFSLAWLFWLTTVVAAVATTVRLALDHPWIGIILLGYAVLIVGYVVSRMYADFFYGAERQRIRKYRRKLMEWANSTREARRREDSSEGEESMTKHCRH